MLGARVGADLASSTILSSCLLATVVMSRSSPGSPSASRTATTTNILTLLYQSGCRGAWSQWSRLRWAHLTVTFLDYGNERGSAFRPKAPRVLDT